MMLSELPDPGLQRMPTSPSGLLENSRPPWKKSDSLAGKTMLERHASGRGEGERPGSVHLPPSYRGTKEKATRGPSRHSLPGIQPGSVKTYVVKLPGLLNLKREQINGLFSSTKFGSNFCTAIATRNQICSGRAGLP